MNSHRLNNQIFLLAFSLLIIGSFFVYQHARAANGCDINIGYNSVSSGNSCSMSAADGYYFSGVSGNWSASGVDPGGSGGATLCLDGGRCISGSYNSSGPSGGSLSISCLPGHTCTGATLNISATGTAELSASAGASEVPTGGCPDGGNFPDCNIPFHPTPGFCSPAEQVGDVGQWLNFSLPLGGGVSGYSWSSAGGPPSDNDSSYDVQFNAPGNYAVSANYNGYGSTCLARVGVPGDGPPPGEVGGCYGSCGFGPPQQLILEICLEGVLPPGCPLGVQVPVNQVGHLRAWYNDSGGQADRWMDFTDSANWDLSNEGTNPHQQSEDSGYNGLWSNNFNSSCNVGPQKNPPYNSCPTARGVRLVPVDSVETTVIPGQFMGIVLNDTACLPNGNGSGCPSIDANYSGTSGHVWYRVVAPVPTVDLRCGDNSNGPCEVAYGSSTTLSWTTTDATECTASVDWLGPKSVNSGPQSTGNLNEIRAYTYTLACSGPGGSNIADTVTVNVSPPKPTVSSISQTQPNYCISGPAVTIGWNYSDPASSPQTAYQVQIDNSALFNSPVFDPGKESGSSISRFSGQGVLQFNTNYLAKVRVWNSYDVASAWSNSVSFTTPDFAYPQVNFTWSSNGISENSNPPINSPVQFTDQTVFQGNQNQRSWGWLFGDGTSSQQNPTKTYSSEGTYYITLTATDSKNQSCSRTRGPLNMQKAIPKWREVAPR